MNCIVCQSKNSSSYLYDNHKGKLGARVLDTFYRILKSNANPFSGLIGVCKECGHGVLQKTPTQQQVETYYRSAYWSDRDELTKNFTLSNDAYKFDLRASSQVDFIEGVVSLGDLNEILEIGAGPAFASLLLREKAGSGGLRLNACEPGLVWEKHYEKHGVQKISDYFPFSTEKRFDYIHTSHWLEHIVNLHDTIQHLGRMTTIGGYIFVEVPNTEHFYWDLQLKDTPHVHFFTRRSLVRAFENHGFQTMKTGLFGQTFFDKFSGKQLSESDYHTERSDGFWLRSLFKKI